jgi:hypothetical protein
MGSPAGSVSLGCRWTPSCTFRPPLRSGHHRLSPHHTDEVTDQFGENCDAISPRQGQQPSPTPRSQWIPMRQYTRFAPSSKCPFARLFRVTLVNIREARLQRLTESVAKGLLSPSRLQSAHRRADRMTTPSSSPSGSSTAPPTRRAGGNVSHGQPRSRRPAASTGPLGRRGLGHLADGDAVVGPGVDGPHGCHGARATSAPSVISRRERLTPKALKAGSIDDPIWNEPKRVPQAGQTVRVPPLVVRL